jgi:four helix bundle protein
MRGLQHVSFFQGFARLAGKYEICSRSLSSNNQFPRHELYGLSQQLRRAAVSVPSNIAQGKGHRSDREFGHFLLHARGSLLEVQTQVMIAQELQYLRSEEAQRLLASADAIGRSLNSLINSLGEKAA